LIEATSAVLTEPSLPARWRTAFPPLTAATCASEGPRLCNSSAYARAADGPPITTTSSALEVPVVKAHVWPTSLAELRYFKPGTGVTVSFVTGWTSRGWIWDLVSCEHVAEVAGPATAGGTSPRASPAAAPRSDAHELFCLRFISATEVS
jgi:hypothetical protein